MSSKWMMTSVALFVLAAVSGYAQTTRELRITVPFQFDVHDQVMPAGDYLVSQVGTNGLAMFSVRSAEDRHAIYFLGNAIFRNDMPGPSRAVFHRYGTSYFLADIWWGGRFASGIDLPESKTERELANTASLSGPDQVVLLASR